jgi:hypothetical protein
MIRPWLLAILVVVFYLLHQDVWFWREARPVVFGVLPIGLFYHACYTLAVCGVVWVLVRVAWPSHLDGDEPGTPPPGRTGGSAGSGPKGPR